jgi:hypothetical protein
VSPLRAIDQVSGEIGLHCILNRLDLSGNRHDLRLLQGQIRTLAHASRKQDIAILNGSDHLSVAPAGTPAKSVPAWVVPAVMVSVFVFMVVLVSMVMPFSGKLMVSSLVAQLTRRNLPILDDKDQEMTGTAEVGTDGFAIVGNCCNLHLYSSF